MVDTYVSGAYEVIREGSSPFSDTIIQSIRCLREGCRTPPNEVRSGFERGVSRVRRLDCGIIENYAASNRRHV